MYLVWESPRGRIVHGLEGSITIVGSDKLSDLWLEDPTVSKRHAIVQQENGKVTITDLRSEDGTRINGAALVPEVPSTLEPGDFINLGEVVLGFHKTPPPPAPRPVAAAAPPPPKPPPPPRRPAQKKPAPPRTRPAVGATVSRRPAAPVQAPRSIPASWKWIAIGLAFLLVGCLGALVAVLATRGDAPKPQAKPAEPAKIGKADPEQPDDAAAKKPAPVEEKPPEKNDDDVVKGLPVAGWAPLTDYPELVETDGRFFCVKLHTWGPKQIEATGGDGQKHRFDAALVVRVMDRSDLARRAQKQIERVDVADQKACGELARRCMARHIRGPLEPFLKRIVNLRPNDPLNELLKVIAKGKQ